MWRLRAAAAIAAARGDMQQAITLLEELVGQAQQMESAIDLLWARLDLAACLTEVDRRRAVEQLQQAALLAGQVGARSQYRLALQRLRRLGVRAWRRPPGATRGPGQLALSPREEYIARLAASGASNREIADSLLIAPKTVERHITNVLAKLGLRNRTELAGLLASAGASESSVLVRGSPDDRGQPRT
jgi:DNA-binding CsgD family transcriptional regulator